MFNVDEWVNARLPKASEITLTQRKIFIVPSRMSVGLLTMIILLFFLGINFQNSLVYAICFWLVAVLVINIFYCYRNLAGLTIKAIAAEPCFSGEKMVLELEISRPLKDRKSAIFFGWRKEDIVEVNLVEQQSTRIKLSHSTDERGRFLPPRIDIFTRYPTGLATSWSYVTMDIEGIVYPAPIEQVNHGSARNLEDEAENGVEILNGSSDFSGVREYQAGDSPKHIHWGQYAKTGDLYTKSFVDYEGQELWLDWDSLGMSGVEMRLSHLSALVLSSSEQQRQFGLRIPGTVIPPNGGETHKILCLTALALYGLPAAEMSDD